MAALHVHTYVEELVLKDAPVQYKVCHLSWPG
jgi:hypothetical protein